jgi:hypothetical protein
MATPFIAAALVAVGPGTAMEASAEPFDDVKVCQRAPCVVRRNFAEQLFINARRLLFPTSIVK